MKIPWNRKYQIKSYIKGSLWLVPFFAVVLYRIVSWITIGFDDWLVQTGRIDKATSFFGFSVAGAQTMLNTAITANLSFLVFTFGSLLVAIQVASGQYTPRVIATTLLRENGIRISVGYFIFTFLFATRELVAMGDESLHQFNLFVAGILGVGSVVVFLYLIDYAARFLRPVSIMRRVAEYGMEVVQSLYPKSGASPNADALSGRRASPQRTVVHTGTSGSVLAVDVAGLVAQARRVNGVIEFVPYVGDFVAVDEPLFRLYGGAASCDDDQLRSSVALGSERTLEQDPTFAFRILVDIAIKALSAAINDPTTAVIAIDQLHRLLRQVGRRHVNAEGVFDASGELRLIFRTPNWDDFVHLTFTEIRQYGATSVQVMRRLRAMLNNLVQILPPQRHAGLRQQMALLDRTIEANFPFPEDRALAMLADPQGLGSAVGSQSVAAPPPG